MVIEFRLKKNFYFNILERVIRLQFSEIERMYYDRVWNECRDEFKREFHHLWQKRERERNGNLEQSKLYQISFLY
jgi:hypothetical protein